jgi:hypothetical protein
MTLRDLAGLVAHMREAQRLYFRHRRPGDLEVSRALERDVDLAVQEVLSPGLFGDPPPAAPSFDHEEG